MSDSPNTVNAYLAQLTEDRREVLQAVRAVILENLPKGYEEGIQYGMIGYYVPHNVYPRGYHCDPRQPLPFASLASQKNHMALYLMGIYGNPEQEDWFRKAWIKSGKKLDMGKSCVRFKKLEDVPLQVIGQAVKRVPVAKLIAHYEAILANRPRQGSKKTATKKRAARKGSTTRKSADEQTTKKKRTKKKSVKRGNSASRTPATSAGKKKRAGRK